jgi:hypothetical protein
VVLSKLRRVTDLFVRGREVPLPDGSLLYVQALNSYERAAALTDSNTARARFTLALADGGEELLRIKARLFQHGRDEFIRELADSHVMYGTGKIVSAIDEDAEWHERLSIIRQAQAGESATPLTEQETELVTKLTQDYLAEIDRRRGDERDYYSQGLGDATDEDLIELYKQAWLEQKGNIVASAEYRQSELYYATRYCNAIASEAGTYDHTACNGHEERVFAERTDVREAPDALLALLTAAIEQIDFRGGDADLKGSARPMSSSDSSPPPSSPELGEDSGSTETPANPPGTSEPPSASA